VEARSTGGLDLCLDHDAFAGRQLLVRPRRGHENLYTGKTKLFEDPAQAFRAWVEHNVRGAAVHVIGIAIKETEIAMHVIRVGMVHLTPPRVPPNPNLDICAAVRGCVLTMTGQPCRSLSRVSALVKLTRRCLTSTFSAR